jgi:hypothetical protein
MTKERVNRPRRRLLKGMLAASVVPKVALPQKQRSRNPITAENQKPGSSDWQLTHVKLDRVGGYRSPSIEGFCSRQSLEAGQTLDIFVSTNPPARFEIEIFRTGYYGGKGARLMTKLGPFQGKVQPDPAVGPNRVRECKWEPVAQLKIPDDWLSGVYLGRLTVLPESVMHGAWQSYVIFIVRDHRPAGILFQCSDNTWQAYNRWPDDYSLYTDPRGAWVGDVSVSFDRPYGKYCQIYENPQSVGSGEFLLWEYPLSYWLEQHGYDVTYCSNRDMIEPDCVKRARMFVSVGHDEYWDPRQYDNAMVAVKSGVNMLFLSGNSVCGVTPFQPSSSGKPDRIITRVGRYGGVGEDLKGKVGPFRMEGPSERLLMGARTIVPANGGGDWIVVKPDHWIFEGAGMKKGDRIPGLVGWEFHGDPAEIPELEVVAEGIALKVSGETAHWTATIYPGPKDNYVFNAATIWWAQGLSSPPGHMLPWSHWVRPHGPDPRVQRITENLLRRALRSG